MAFSVVHFLSTDDVKVASSHWLSSDKTTCSWPPFNEVIKVKRAILEHKNPESTWIRHEIAVIGSYPNYLTAEIRCRKALDTSSLDTDEPEAESVEPDNGLQIQELSESSAYESVPKRARLMDLPSATFASVTDESSIHHIINSSINHASNKSNSKTCHLKSEVLDLNELGASECEKLILSQINQILKVQHENSLLLQQLVPSLPRSPSCGELDSSFMPKIPADNFLELDDWEAFINDPTSFKYAVKLFSSKVDDDVGKSTRRLLYDIFTNKLAMNFNWVGASKKETKPKRSFKDLKTVNFIFRSLKESVSLKDVSLRLVEKLMKDWLRHAPARYLNNTKT